MRSLRAHHACLHVASVAALCFYTMTAAAELTHDNPTLLLLMINNVARFAATVLCIASLMLLMRSSRLDSYRAGVAAGRAMQREEDSAARYLRVVE